ncbi:hypothetical protein JIN85_03455 [Luteolibacter pohnpeiensis]|uniref:Sialate O-acetylesterase domain-containing protein n=1 Tax=Luteolibacter pohnpeiensis TaxID=454153 RepID=A0A934S2W5_9BACT|nr:LamG-like jellyroll fold domain-containing protein [Luteolibacter pohnpeiensis]MBK1881456.1 hypothetical protein [Luteolibacter pohnpeiensis]
MKFLRFGLLAGFFLPACASAGVLAHYSFDSDFSDSSGNSQNATLVDADTSGNSGIITSAGDFAFGGGAMDFSSDRDYLDVPTTSFASGSSYTIAFWARKTAGDTGNPAQWDMVIGDRENANYFIALNDTTGAGLRWRGISSATNQQADFTLTKDYAWHHYAVVAAGTTVSLYLDGALISTETGKDTAFHYNTIGEAYLATNNFDFHGQIDEMWVLDEALDAASVNTLYTSNTVEDDGAFQGFQYHFDGDFTDSGISANDGTPGGAAAITTDSAAIAAGSGALSLDGADDSKVSLATPGSYDSTHPWTATWWARRTVLGADQGMVMGKAGNSGDFIWLNDKFTGLRFRSSNSTNFDFDTPIDSELRHYALVADGAGNLNLYLDGQLTQTLTGNTSFAVDTIGAGYPTSSLHYNFNGTLDEVRLSPVALGAEQIEAIYEEEKPEETSPEISRLIIVLQGGQSNSDGRATITGLPAELQAAQSDVDFYYRVEGGTAKLTTLRPGLSESSQFGPEITLGRHMANLYANETGTRVAIIKYANGGTNLNVQWKAGGTATTSGDGTEYVAFQETVTSGLAALAAKYPNATLELESMVWMQGESDAVSGWADLYQANLTAFIADVRLTYGSNLPFVIGRLSSKQTSLTSSYLKTVQAAQDAVAAADPLTSIFNTDSFELNSDNLHFSANGQQDMGSAFAAKTAYYGWVVDTFSNEDIQAGLAEPDADRDGDGQSNEMEFLGASDPYSSTSQFNATFLKDGPDSGIISHPSSAYRLYTVEKLLEDGSGWEEILTSTPGTGEMMNQTLEATGSRGIYRVTVALP